MSTTISRQTINTTETNIFHTESSWNILQMLNAHLPCAHLQINCVNRPDHKTTHTKIRCHRVTDALSVANLPKEKNTDVKQIQNYFEM